MIIEMLSPNISHATEILTSLLFWNKRKILMWLTYVGLIAFVIWFVTGLVQDYFSHISADTPLEP